MKLLDDYAQLFKTLCIEVIEILKRGQIYFPPLFSILVFGKINLTPLRLKTLT
jgi:hypothetical protein